MDSVCALCELCGGVGRFVHMSFHHSNFFLLFGFSCSCFVCGVRTFEYIDLELVLLNDFCFVMIKLCGILVL